MHKTTGILVSILAVASCLAACSRMSPNVPYHRDRVLFDKARTALRRHQFTIANLNLQTLVNTYPDSQYSDEARRMLQDPRVTRCEGGFSNTPASVCNPEAVATH